jgi:hypothetical protein
MGNPPKNLQHYFFLNSSWSFCKWCFTQKIHPPPPSHLIQHSSSFKLHPKLFILHPSSFNLHPSLFILLLYKICQRMHHRNPSFFLMQLPLYILMVILAVKINGFVIKDQIRRRGGLLIIRTGFFSSSWTVLANNFLLAGTVPTVMAYYSETWQLFCVRTFYLQNFSLFLFLP